MNWDKLRIILALSRYRTQSAAAENLGINQSTVSRQLNAIEAELGHILFIRTYSGFTLTEAGHVAIKHATKIEATIQNLDVELDHSLERPSGSVTIIGNDWMLNWLIKNHFSEFKLAAPSIQLHFNAAQYHWSLTKGDVELALWFETPAGDGEFAIPVCEVPYAVYALKGAPFNDLPWASFKDSKAPKVPWTWLSERNMYEENTILVTANDANLVMEIVKTGLGKALLPCVIAEAEPNLCRVDNPPPYNAHIIHSH